MRFFLVFIFGLLGFSASAQDILPPAQGKFSFVFAQSKNAAPLEQGTVVQFLFQEENRAPRDLRVEGLVLGSHDNVVFFEVFASSAAKLVHAMKTGTLKIRRFKGPDTDQLADRRKAATDMAQISIAPRMRQLTVSVPASPDTIATFAPGDRLIFPEAGERTYSDWVDGKRVEKTQPLDIWATFVAARPLNNERFELTLVADPKDARMLAVANLRGNLTVRDKAEKPANAVEDNRCFVRERTRDGVQKIQIPCVN